jgi:hypothetical protein
MTIESSIPRLSLSAFQSVLMTLNRQGWWDVVPAAAGWYVVETDAPLSVISKVPPPKEKGKHYKVAKRLKDAQFLIAGGVAITPDHDGAPFIVYSGEHGDLKARAREHTHGDKGTACMCLSQYESLWRFQWKFYYRTCEEHVPGSCGNKALRTYLEQKWRGENGWPILCTH